MIIDSNNINTPGKIIDDRYEIIKLIGAGAMGTVLHCKDTSLRSSDIALKFLKQEYVEDEKQFERFKNEALLMRELNHPNVVHVYDLRSTVNRAYYITMEYIDGSSLKILKNDLSNQSFTFRDAVRILKDIALGMSYAHKKGIIHRDLKPDNVLISNDGEIKITDFGLGKALISEDFTDLGEAVGTPHYMAPEQLRGLKLDKRCDIYSFGIMAFELATGDKPFNDENYLGLANKHLSEHLPRINDKTIPSWYNEFLSKCCAKEKEHRFQSFDEIYEILDTFHKTGSLKKFNSSFKKDFKTKAKDFKNKISPKILIGFVIAPFILGALMFLLGALNKETRIKFGPSILNFEAENNIELDTVKNIFFGKETAQFLTAKKSSFHDAIKNKNEEAVELLLSSKYNFKLSNEDFILAVKNNSLKATDILLKDTKLDLELNKALSVAIQQENLEIIELLLNNGAKASKTQLRKIKNKEVKDLIKKSANKKRH